MSVKKATQKSTKSTTATGKKSKGFTDEERAAMKERAKELKAEERASRNRADGESDLLAKIAEMAPEDRAIAERLRAIVAEAAPGLTPKTWYGMPAYTKNYKVVCFFQSADKFKARYATFGFNEDAKIDEIRGLMLKCGFSQTMSHSLRDLHPLDARGGEQGLTVHSHRTHRVHPAGVAVQAA